MTRLHDKPPTYTTTKRGSALNLSLKFAYAAGKPAYAARKPAYAPGNFIASESADSLGKFIYCILHAAE